MSVSTQQICVHCGLPIPASDLVTEISDENEYVFCCHGCRMAWLIIRGAGLDGYYQRQGTEQGALKEAFARQFDRDYLQSFVIDNKNGAEINLIIDGIRCASCIWLIERIMLQAPGVHAARVNFATHRLLLHFDPQQTDAVQLCQQLARLGYLPRPYSQDELRNSLDRERQSLLLRFGTAVFLSMQLMGFSIALYAGYFKGIDEQTRQLLQILAALVTTPVVFYSGFPFLRGAWYAIRNFSPNMDLLIAMGSLTAYTYSLFALASGREVYFDTSAMIITLILAGRLFETGARHRASAGLDRLLQLAPSLANRLTDGQWQQVDSRLLEPGDLIQVAPGDRFPIDGQVTEGTSEVNEAAVTGESVPTLRQKGDSVKAGTQNINGSLTIKVTAKATDSFISRIGRMVEQAQARKAPIQTLADRISAIFIPTVLLIALLTFIGWGMDQNALLHAITVLVVACPCALGLATPTAVMVASGRAAEEGVLFRGGDTLEAAARLDTLAFDKTGTLTEGRPKVVCILAKGSETELLQVAANLEAGSRHPFAHGIIEEAKRNQLTIRQMTDIQQIPGKGLIATQEGLIGGSTEFLREQGINFPLPDETEGISQVHFAHNHSYLGTINLQDDERPEAKTVLYQLKQAGYSCLLLSGDHLKCAQIIAEKLHMDRCLAPLTPAEKTTEIEQLRQQGHQVLMTGDGINDAPALAAANVSCSLVGSSDIAMEQAQLLLTRPNLQLLPWALKLARKNLAIIHQNLFWAFSYNLIAIPLAASGKLLPVYGAAAMALSSIGVLLNSLRLKRISPP